MRNLFKNINFLPAVFLCVYPVLLIILSIVFLQYSSFKASYLILAIITYYGANISVGLGMHRLWSHGAYKTTLWVEYLLAFISAGTLQGPILAWASDHFKHHRYTDGERDPHSPSKYKGKIKGFLWSHVGWMIVGESTYKNIDKITLKKLGRNKAVMWQYRNYWVLTLTLNVVLPVVIGFFLYGTLTGVIATFLFMGLGRALQQQMTFCVNSLCHFVGKRTYYAGTARDIWWMFFLLLGENWHNFHHAFARDYRNGAKWYQLDIHKWLIALMEKCGLAWDLVRTSPERIAAKVNETEQSFLSAYKEKLESILNQTSEISKLANKFRERYESAATSAANLKNHVSIRASKKLQKYEEILNQLRSKLLEIMNDCDTVCDKTVIVIQKKLSYVEQAVMKLSIDSENPSL